MSTPPVRPSDHSSGQPVQPPAPPAVNSNISRVQAAGLQVICREDELDEWIRLHGLPDESEEEPPLIKGRKNRLLIEDSDDEIPKKKGKAEDLEEEIIAEINAEAEDSPVVFQRLKRASQSPAGKKSIFIDLSEDDALEGKADPADREEVADAGEKEAPTAFQRLKRGGQSASGKSKKARVTVVKEGKVSALEAEEEHAQDAIQQLSIRQIALSRILKTCPPKSSARKEDLSVVKQIARLAKRMIASYNKRMEASGKQDNCFQPVKFDKEIFQEKWDPDDHDGFHLKIYSRTIYTFSKLAHVLEDLGAQAQLTSSRVDTILFFYREEQDPNPKKGKNEPNGVLFALPTGEGWSATEECTDWKFSRSVAKRCLRQEINSYNYRGLVGNNLSDKLILKKDEILSRTRTFDKLITSFRACLKPDSSLYQLPFFQTKQQKPPQRGINLTAEMGCVHPCKQLALSQIPALLDHFARISRGETTYKIAINKEGKIDPQPRKPIPEEDGANFWDDIILAGHKEAKKLASALLNEVWLCFKGNRETCLDFYHKHVNDYCNASLYELFYRRSPLVSWSTPKSAQEMIQLLRQHCPSLSQCRTQEEFQEEINHVVVKFKTPAATKEDPFINYFEGEVRCQSKVFFKVGGQWYRISTDYTKWVEIEFQTLLKRSLVPDEKKLLPKPWPERRLSHKEEKFDAEGIYNKSYANTPFYLHGDKITPEGIELFDLAYYGKNEEILYLIAVKSGFGRTTREACAQIDNSSEKLRPELLGETKQSLLDLLIERIKRRDDSDPFAHWGGEDAFKKLFLKLYREKKIVYVYGFVDSAKKERKLRDELTLTAQFSPSDFAQIPSVDPARAILQLKKTGYLDDKGGLTSKFLSTTKKAFTENEELTFTKEAKSRIYDQLYRRGSSKFDSTIARLELINLEKNLQAKGFGFAICQISRTAQALPQATQTDDELPGLLRLDEMPKVDEIEYCEGDEFEWEGHAYTIDRTLPDGACGLHAVLGSNENGVFTASGGGKAVRLLLVERLRKLNPDAFSRIAREQLTAHLQEYFTLRDKCNPSTLILFQQNDVKRLFQKEYLKKREGLDQELRESKDQFWGEFISFFKSLSAQDPKAIQLLGFMGEKSDLATLQQNETLLKKTFDENIQTVRDWITKELGPRHLLSRALGEVQGIENEFEEMHESLFSHPQFKEAYLKALLNSKYWLFSTELEMVAQLFNKKLLIYHQRRGQVELAGTFQGQDPSAPIVRVFHEQIGNYAHFSHISEV